MNDIITRLNATINENLQRISHLTEAEFTTVPAPGKWSKKQIIGHLVDSAHNNLRRFIVGQYQPNVKIIYDQNFWNEVNHYQDMPTADLLRLWVMMNERIAHVLSAMPLAHYTHTVDTGQTEISLKTIHWLAGDYVLHMQHHINQMFPGTYNIAYPQ